AFLRWAVAELNQLLFQIAKETRKFAYCFKVFGSDAVRIEVHNAVANATDPFQLFTKCLSVNGNAELFPALRVFQQADVFAETQVARIINFPLCVSRIANCRELRFCKLVSNQVANIVLDFAEQKERFSELRKLQAQVRCRDNSYKPAS